MKYDLQNVTRHGKLFETTVVLKSFLNMQRFTMCRSHETTQSGNSLKNTKNKMIVFNSIKQGFHKDFSTGGQ